MSRHCDGCVFGKVDFGVTKEKGVQYRCKLSYTQGYMNFLDNNKMDYVCSDRKEEVV